jgi:hypothetical protein
VPLIDAVHVVRVPAFTLDEATIVTSELALVAGLFKIMEADGAVGVFDVPLPSSDSEPLVDFNLHF